MTFGKRAVENEANAFDTVGETSPLLPGQTGKLISVEVSPFPFNMSPWLSGLEKAFGYKLLLMLAASQHLMKGFVQAFVGPATQFMLASYNVQGPRMQIFSGIIALPWAMKPMIGLLSDCVPIRGYHKAPYILIACFVGLVACAMVGSRPHERFDVDHLVLCLFFMQLQFSTCDLLTEAKYAEKMQSNPKMGPDLMTYVWFGLQGGGLLATMCVGPVLTAFGPKMPFLIALLPASFIIVPLAKNYLEEIPSGAEELAESRRKLFQQKEALFLCVLMFVGTMILTVVGIAFESIELNAIAAILVAIVMLTAFSVLLRPLIAKVNAFFLIQTSLGFSVGGASFYFYTDSAAKYHDGPHFSMEFYTSVLGVVGSVCSLVGIYTYQRYMRAWKYQSLLMMTNLVLSALSMLDVMMLSRWNLKVGIPDHIMVLGGNVFQTVIGQWMWMPGIVILSQLCPKGMEATMYALLAGCHNLGNTIASNCGALVLQYLNCAPSGEDNEDKQFDNLWIGALFSTLLPMVTLFWLPYLIPDARQTDSLLAEDDRDATKGSLWKRWTASE